MNKNFDGVGEQHLLATRYLRPESTARFLNIGISTLWLWAKTIPGFPRPIKLGPRVTIFSVEELNKFIGSQRGDMK